MVDERGKVTIFHHPWRQKLNNYFKRIEARFTSVEYGALSEAWSEADFADFKGELVADGLIRTSDAYIDFHDQEGTQEGEKVDKPRHFRGKDRDLKLDLYLKWVNRYGRPEDADDDEEPKNLWDAVKTIAVIGLAVGGSLAGTRKAVELVRDVAHDGFRPLARAVVPYAGMSFNGFDASNLALGALGTALTFNPLWLGLGVLSYGTRGVAGELVNGVIPNQTAGVGQQFNLTLNMREIFGVAAGEITITQANGDPLPGWLQGDIEPELVGSVDIDGQAKGLAISGNMAYVAAYDAGLQIVDVSNATHPVLKGNCSIASAVFGVAISGNMAYVAADSGLQIIDVSNATHPVLKDSYSASYNARGVVISGDMAYVANYYAGLQIIDVSNATHPVLSGSYYISDNALGVAVNGDMVYVVSLGSFLVIDVSNVTHPILKGSCSTSSYALGVAISGNTAYVAEYNSWYGLQVIDVSNATHLVLVGNFSTSGRANGVAINGDMAYVATDSGLQIIDVSNAAHPVLKGSYRTFYANGVAISGDAVYLATISGLQIFDISSWWSFIGTPQCSDVGRIDIKVTAVNGTNGAKLSDVFSINVTVSPPSVGTSLASQAWCCAIGVGQYYSFTIDPSSFTNIYGAPMTYTAIKGDDTALPSWLGFNSSTGTFTGTPVSVNDIGSLTLKVTAVYAECMTQVKGASQTFTLNITQTLSATNIALIAGIVAGGLVALSLVTGTAIACYRYRKHHMERVEYGERRAYRERRVSHHRTAEAPRCQELELPPLPLPPASPAGASEVPVIEAKNLRLVRILGAGGFGTVYEGTWGIGSTEVAVKVLNPACAALPELFTTFEREAAIMHRLRHPNVVQIYGICRDVRHGYCIVMEYMHGGTLEGLLFAKDRVLSWQPTLWQILMGCVVGLQHLHARGIMHRDVKSSNVLLTYDLRAKWADFGLARTTGGGNTTKTQGQGTLVWMPPETIKGQTHYTYKTDIYSFAILLWQMFAREEPYKDLGQFEIAPRVVAGGRPSIPLGMPAGYAVLMQRCWAQDPAARPDMTEVKTELDRIKGGEAMTAATGATATSLGAAVSAVVAIAPAVVAPTTVAPSAALFPSPRVALSSSVAAPAAVSGTSAAPFSRH